MHSPLHSQGKPLYLLICLGALALSAQAGAADLQSVAPAQSLTLSDPAGSGRTLDITFLSGSGAYRISNGGIGANGLLASGQKPESVAALLATMNTAQVTLSPLDDAVISEAKVTLASGRKMRGQAAVTAVVSQLTVDAATGDVLAASAVGGAIESATRVENLLDGGEVHFKNLQFDLPHRLVYADIGYRATLEDGTLAPLVNHEHVAMWTVSDIQGPTALPWAAMAAAQSGDFSQLQGLGIEVLPSDQSRPGEYVAKSTTSFQGLRVTPEGLSYVAQGLGLPEGSLPYNTLDAVNAHPEGWGSITANLYFAASVPEPSQAALLGLGLLGVALATRRRPPQMAQAAA